jgi:bacitracin transport system permease protein
MIHIVKTEFEKLKRLHLLLIGFIGMTFPAILSVFTQAVVTDEGKVQNFDFSALINSSIWNSVTIFMPIIFTLTGGYIITREYTDNTLKNILTVPLSFRRLLYGKLLSMAFLSILFGLYSYVVTLIIGLIYGISGFNAANLFSGLFQIIGISFFTYIAILPIIAFTSRVQGHFIGGVIISFIFGYCAMFIKNTTLRSLYPILSGLTVMGFDTGTFMNTSEPGNVILSIISLTATLLSSIIVVALIKPPQTNFQKKKRKMFLRHGQQTR